jgi:methyltransferase-like protein/SAM-dependent methyltransferase
VSSPPQLLPPESYDDVRYPPYVHPQTHPDRLFVIATLMGMKPAPVQRCRILELGCGDGSNLIPVAYAHPGSECFGIDTSAATVADGQSVAAELGLGNLSLRHADVMDLTPAFGRFDYIIAHGLYSWVPPAVAAKVLAICRENLAPQGVAYVSYNVYPAGHFRLMLREMMRHHVRRISDPKERISQAKGLLKFLADMPPAPRPDDDASVADRSPGKSAVPAGGAGGAPVPTRQEVFRQLLRMEFDRTSRLPDAFFFHDDLATYNEPVYFHEFAERAAGQGLQYLAEAEFGETQPPVPNTPSSLPKEALRVLDQIPGGDVIAREQYADFVKCRQFRQTLLCHAGAPLERPPASQRVMTLYASTAARPIAPTSDLRSHAPENFQVPGRGAVTLTHPVAKAALRELAESWPRRLHFNELLERWRARVAAEGTADPAADAPALADLLLTGYGANLISLHVDAPNVAATPGDRPAASRLARAQSRRAPRVTNLLGATVNLTGPLSPRLLRLLDGTRDRDALAADLAAECRRDGMTFEKDGRQIADAGGMAALIRADLDEKLASLARLALLEP